MPARREGGRGPRGRRGLGEKVEARDEDGKEREGARDVEDPLAPAEESAMRLTHGASREGILGRDYLPPVDLSVK